MSRYRFSVSSSDTRQEGTIESDSFRAAVDALGEHVTVQLGDVLEFGVNGFPPASYRCATDCRSGFHRDSSRRERRRDQSVRPAHARLSISPPISSAFVVP